MNDLIQAIDSLAVTENEHHPGGPYLLGGNSGLANAASLTLPKVNPAAFTILWSDSNILAPGQDQLKLLSLPAQSSPVLKTSLLSLQRLTSAEAKVVYSATLTLDNAQTLEYDAGDSIGLLCMNSETDVNWLLDRIDFADAGHADKPFRIEACGDKPRPVPAWLLPGALVTARYLLTYCCELHVPVTRRITRLLAECCSSVAPADRSDFSTANRQSIRLLEFSSREGTAMFDRYIRDPNVTLLDLLNSFPACRVPLPRLLEILPRLHPRAYTVISRPDSSRLPPHTLEIVFTRVDFVCPPDSESRDSGRTADPPGLHRYPHRTHGVCTGWLERVWNARPGHADCAAPLLGLYRRINLNAFSLRADDWQPLIMIGAGTGIAPFLSFLEQEQQERRQRSKNGTTGRKLWLIYGCRSPCTSLLFPDRLAQALSDGLLSHLCLCFSRYPIQSPHVTLPGSTSDPSSSSSCDAVLSARGCFHPGACYVQHCVFHVDRSQASAAHEHRLAQWVLDEHAKIMVCGESRAMAPSVRQAWASLLDGELADRTDAGSGDCGDSPGQAYVKRMLTEKRYLEDIWT